MAVVSFVAHTLGNIPETATGHVGRRGSPLESLLLLPELLIAWGPLSRCDVTEP